MSKVSPTTLAIVENALSATEGRRLMTVHKIVDQGSRVTTRHALRQLVEIGRARYIGFDCNRLYFKVELLAAPQEDGT